MDIQTVLNSRYGINTGLAIARALPPRIGNFVSKLLVHVITMRKSSPINRSVRLNQWIVHNKELTSQELDRQVKKVLFHGAHCLYDFFHVLSDKNKIMELAPLTKNAQKWIDLSRNGKIGGFIVGPHLSNFDLVLLSYAFRGLQGLVLTYGSPTSGYDIQNKIREMTGLEILPATGEETHQKAIDYMKSGGFVITGVDRPLRKKSHMMNFFGYPSPLPAGHIRMALEANVPITVVAARMHPSGLYDVFVSDPIEMIHKNDQLEEVRINGEAVLKVIENFIRKVPEQWLMFYPVWPQFLDQLP